MPQTDPTLGVTSGVKNCVRSGVKQVAEKYAEQYKVRPIAVEPEIPGNSQKPIQPTAPSLMPGSKSVSRPVRSLLQALTVMATAAMAVSTGALVAVNMPLPNAVSPQEGNQILGELVASGFQYQVTRPVNILVMGIDRVPDNKEGSTEEIFAGRSDTMLLIRVDPEQQVVNLLSIPRDTQVEIPGMGLTKINQANASGGPALVNKVISNNFGQVPIDRYVRVSTDAFKELVDQLGGVQVYVPYDMKYKDDTQKLYIDLKQGEQTLNGNQAEQFARFRHDNYGDIGRVQRQQVLLKALRGKLSHPSVVTRVPGILQVMQKYVDTNLSFEEMLALVNFGLKLDQKDVKMVLLPGRFSAPNEFRASYWILDEAGRDRILSRYFGMTAPIASSPDSPAQGDKPVKELRIALQNAATDPDAARQVARKLLKQGYTHVFLANPWPDPQKKTRIIVQGGQDQAADELRGSLGRGEIDATSTGDLESDLTIRVGEDWQGLL
ncbi:MAG: LCP family protein [Synechococcales bacterium]|nr:LCP family protein [Synechococcales bacterium]